MINFVWCSVAFDVDCSKDNNYLKIALFRCVMDEYIYVRIAYGLMLLVFMFCGCLRCCNLWQFPAGKMDVVYPARREAAAAYFSVILLAPCVVYPVGTEDTWTFVRCFWIIYVPAAASIALKHFFSKDASPKVRRCRLIAVGAIPAVVLGVLFCFACLGGSRLGSGHWLVYAVGALGILLAAYMIYVLAWICVKSQSSEDELGRRRDDFPRHFCRAISGVTVAGLAMSWAVFIADTPMMHALIAAVALLAGMGILITILHRQWNPGPERDGRLPVMTSAKERRKNMLSDAQLESLERRIRQIVENERLYLDPDLRRDTLQERLEVNHSYLSEVFARRFGSLNRYLNLLRIEHAQRYAAEHPNVKLSEVARISGFGSMNTFYRARKQYEEDESLN